MMSHDVAELYVAIGFAVSVVLTAVSTLTFYIALRKRLPNVLFMFYSTPGYLQWVYLRNRSDIGSRWLDTLAILSIASPLAALVLALVLANIFPIS